MSRFRFVFVFVALLLVASIANATPRVFPRGNFDDGFAAGVRAARGGHVGRNFAPPVVEIRRGPFGRVRSVRVK